MSTRSDDNLTLAYRNRFNADPKLLNGFLTGCCEWQASWEADVFLLEGLRALAAAGMRSETDPVRLAQYDAAYFNLRDLIHHAEDPTGQWALPRPPKPKQRADERYV